MGKGNLKRKAERACKNQRTKCQMKVPKLFQNKNLRKRNKVRQVC